MSDTIKNPPSKCPIHPLPVDLPNPIPNNLQNALNQINNTILQLFQSSMGPGMYAAIVYKGKIIWGQGYGTTNLSETTTPTIDTIFSIGSVTKIFPTMTLYNMYYTGLLSSLDTPVNSINPDFNIIDPFPNNKPIRFREIACQLSGLPREAPCRPCNVTTTQVFAALSKESLIFPVYHQPSYSNLGFAIIGRVLAESLGKTSFESWTQKNIFDVLGMASSGFDYTPDVIARMAIGYVGNQAVPPPELGWVGPAGQAYSTIRDLVQLVSFFTNGNNFSQIMDWGTRKQMMLPQWINPDGVSGFGTPWELSFQQSYLVRNKGGNVAGYSALFSVVPEIETGLVMLWNYQANEFNFSQSVYDLLLPALTETLIENKPAIPFPPQPNKYVGTYSLPYITNATISVVQAPTDVLVLNIIGFGDFLLEYVDPTTMKLYIPQGILPCMDGDLLAANQEIVNFTQDSSGNITGFSCNGFAYALYFEKL